MHDAGVSQTILFAAEFCVAHAVNKEFNIVFVNSWISFIKYLNDDVIFSKRTGVIRLIGNGWKC